jgi:hypothetical protein
MSNSKIKTSIRSNLPKSPHVGLLKRLDEVDTHHTSIIFHVSNNYHFFYNVIFFNFNLAAFHTKLEKLCTISCSVLAVSETAKMAHFSLVCFSLFRIGLLLVLICWTKESTGAAFSLEEEFKQLKENYVRTTAGSAMMESVFCDFSKLPSDPGKMILAILID